MGSDVGTVEISGKATHDFSDCTYIKNVRENIENIFDTMLNNYGSPLDGGYYPEVDTYDLSVGDEVPR